MARNASSFVSAKPITDQERFWARHLLRELPDHVRAHVIGMYGRFMEDCEVIERKTDRSAVYEQLGINPNQHVRRMIVTLEAWHVKHGSQPQISGDDAPICTPPYPW